MNMSVRRSILYLLGVSFLLTAVIGGMGSHFVMRNAAQAEYQYCNTTKPAMYVEEVKANFWKAHAFMLQAVLDKEQELIDLGLSRAVELYRENDRLLRLYAQTESSGPVEDALLAAVVENRSRFHALNARALELGRRTFDDEAIALFNTYNNQVLLPVMKEFTAALDKLSDHVLEEAALANAANQSSSERAMLAMAGIIAASVIALLLAGYYFASGIIRALSEETGFASAIAEKNFAVALEPELLARKDELGVMAQALTAMRASLMRLIGDLSSSNEAAQKASQHKSVFLSRMSHEIRTPLNAIIGMTHIAKKSKDPATLHDSLNKITTSSTHLLGLINDILDMSKIEAGKFELIEEEFSLEKLLMNVCTVASAKVDEKEQTLLVSLENGLPSRFIGDVLRLSQVLTNLLGNACKFTPVKGTIRLTVSLAEQNSLSSQLRFSIEDTGIGMRPDQIERLFTPFEQADGGTSRQFGGTGLGLSICDKIVKLMDGDIRVQSEFGRGSTFTVTVKLKNSMQYEPAKLDDSVDARQVKVLVLDRFEETRAFFTRLFNGLQVSAATAESGDSALALLRENSDAPFTIIFFDWDTLAEEGTAFVKKIKEKFNGQTAVVALVSATRFAEIEEKAVEAGVNRFLPKPVFPSMVINLVNELLGVPVTAVSPFSSDTERFSGKRILLVEDNEINREIAFAYLEGTELTVDVAENGAEAVEKYLSGPSTYDLVLMDVHMPVMDGLTAAKRIRAEESGRGWPRTPAVAMTANAFKEDIAQCLEAGMDGHLAKPMNADDVMQVLLQYLAGKRQ